MTRTLIQIAAGILLGSLCTWAWVRSSSTTPSEPGIQDLAPAPRRDSTRQEGSVSSDSLEKIVNRISNIEQLLERWAQAANRLRPPPDTHASDLREIEERLDTLATLIRDLVSSPTAAASEPASMEQRAAALQLALEDEPGPNWMTLDELLAIWYVDGERARMEVQLLSFAAVVKRFGRPNLTWGGPEEIVWVYGRDYFPETESYRIQIMLHFVQGVVAKFYVEEN